MSEPLDDQNGNGNRNVSNRKIEANRKNAQKSTGPKTPRGKANSGRNAITHGLFTRQLIDFATQGEDAEEYEILLSGLRIQYEPIGTAEELEVERLALCWWRLKRAWRHENAMNCQALRGYTACKELADERKSTSERDQKDQTLVQQLHSAADEIEETGKFSQEMKDRIFAIDPEIEPLWKKFEKETEEGSNPEISETLQELSSQDRSSVCAASVVHLRIDVIEEMGRLRHSDAREMVIAKYVIPNRYELDKILRYEGLIERQLGRTVDRLERMQRRRKGEMIPPPVSVRLTRG